MDRIQARVRPTESLGLAAVFISGFLLFLLNIFRVRQWIINSIPMSLRRTVSDWPKSGDKVVLLDDLPDLGGSKKLRDEGLLVYTICSFEGD